MYICDKLIIHTKSTTMASFCSRHDRHIYKPRLPKKWTEHLKVNLAEIVHLCTLDSTADFSRIYTGDKVDYPTNEEEVDAFVKDRIKLWLTNVTDCVEAISETLPKENEQ